MSENKATLKFDFKGTLFSDFYSYDALFASYDDRVNKIWGFLTQWMSELVSKWVSK